MANQASPLIMAPRAGSKQARLVSMLSTKRGVTIEKVSKVMGWLPHTTRASLTGLRKRGYLIERSEQKPALYLIKHGRS
jgi:hypothetical protein